MTRDRRLAPRLAAASVVAAAAGAGAGAAGGSPADLAAAAAAAAVVAAGLLLAPGTWSAVPWPAREVAERTSAGWHDVRLLADAMVPAPRDPGIRTTVTARVRSALGDPPLGRPASRRDLDRALTALATDHAAAGRAARP